MENTNKILVMQLCLLTYLVVQVVGCSNTSTPGVDISHATLVSFEQLKEATKNDAHFYWLGSDKKYHYFETPMGFYCLPESFNMGMFDRQARAMIQQNTAPGTMRTIVSIDEDNVINYYHGDETWQPRNGD